MKIGLVIMASGLGKRFGGNKLMTQLDDKPLLQWVIDTTENLFDERIVVTRDNDVKKLCDRLEIPCIYHVLPNRNDTVRLGISALMEKVDVCFFTPGDQPLIKRETVMKLLEVARQDRDLIVRPRYAEVVGSPVGFPRTYFDELLHLPEGKGGSWIASKYETKLCTVEVQEESELWDIDTQADLERVKNLLICL